MVNTKIRLRVIIENILPLLDEIDLNLDQNISIKRREEITKLINDLKKDLNFMLL